MQLSFENPSSYPWTSLGSQQHAILNGRDGFSSPISSGDTSSPKKMTIPPANCTDAVTRKAYWRRGEMAEVSLTQRWSTPVFITDTRGEVGRTSGPRASRLGTAQVS